MQNTVSQIRYWDRVAHEKRFSHPLRLDWLRKYSSKQARILDYGCGYGRTLADLSQASFTNLVGVDFSEQMLARARGQAPGSWLVRNDGHGLPFKNDCFDLVLLFAVLTCIPNDDQQRLLVSEVQRVLHPGGMLYVSDLLINNDERNRERYERDAERFKCYGVFELPEGVVVRHHQREWIEKMMRPFEQLEFESLSVTTMNGNASSAFQYLGRSPQ
ncbi:MAG TPA: class I SAM-dependent methyltransferase [Pyrinomonadaceae bacterium]|jgi:SAM-dependent methyltransferase|nr:class I SAM-dependent methyltransferase [Pyrinomonadaceae bacterium]